MTVSLEQITWTDSSSMDGWTCYETVLSLEPAAIKSVGYVVKETTQFIVVASHLGPDGVDGIMSIPKACITGRRVLK